ncbi:MAG: hypothetical protein D6681_17080 [Calditrichaeota bacterium]|nr:MAG: hypothetical protein D6681_17080 [Calditrichota bacterium]
MEIKAVFGRGVFPHHSLNFAFVRSRIEYGMPIRLPTWQGFCNKAVYRGNWSIFYRNRIREVQTQEKKHVR